jgi:hypothetical protein
VSDPGLTLLELAVAGSGRPTAAVGFGPGLNLIVGSSNTGKSFVFQAMNFMLGGSRAPERIAEARGYDRLLLTIEPTDTPRFRLRRGLEGGKFQLTDLDERGDERLDTARILGESHRTGNEETLSHHLLSLIGLAGRQVRSDQYGTKKALTFRDVVHLTMVDEEQMIKRGSPIFGGQRQEEPKEKSVFALFLTGVDDSEIITQERPKERKARLTVEEQLVESLVREKEEELGRLSASPDELADQASRLEAAIGEASELVVGTQREISALQASRASIFDESTRVNSRLMFLEEQRQRLDLLAAHYRSDRERLLAVVEAGRAYHDLPEGACPLCNQPFPDDSSSSLHDRFESSCAGEIDKITTLSADLTRAIAEFEAEAHRLAGRRDRLDAELSGIDEALQRTLLPKAAAERERLEELVQVRTSVARAETLRATVGGLRDRLDRIREDKKGYPGSRFDNRVTTSVAAGFCEVVHDLLRRWRYPGLKTVAFDPEKADIVIGEKDRSSNGKGYRAVTHAAFVIGLMRYCRSNGFPHPGFVVLDTPLNPFKGPEKAEGEEAVSDEVKEAFLDDLADFRDGQIIVMENEALSESIKRRVNYHQFSANPEVGRYGFFPVTRGE